MSNPQVVIGAGSGGPIGQGPEADMGTRSKDHH